MNSPRHRSRSVYARASRHLSRPRLALVLAAGLAAVAIPVVSAVTRTHSDTPKEPATGPKVTLQAKEVGFWTPADRFSPPVHQDRNPLELGTRFMADQDGWVTGVRFYKAPGERGRHTGSVWDAQGGRLATVTFTGETGSGWQEARFGTPVPVVAGEVYTVSYHSQHGTYVGRPTVKALRSGPLSTPSRRVGVYSYGASRFPDKWNRKNYTYYVGPIYRWMERHSSWPAKPGQTTPASPSSPALPSGDVTGTPAISPSPQPPIPSFSLDPSQQPTLQPTLEPTLEPTGTPEPPASPSASPTPASSPTQRPSEQPSQQPGEKPGDKPTTGPGSGQGPQQPGTSCPGGYPTPACTGVPRAIPLMMKATNIDGAAYKVTTPGAVLDGVHIPGDLLINADDVTVKNSQIDGTVINELGTRHFSFRISDSTVGPANGCLTAPGVGESNFTAERVLVRGHGDGFRVSGDDVTIRDSYVHLCSRPGDHSDGIQTYVSGKGLVFQHNTVDQRDAKDITAPIFITDPRTQDLTLMDNLVMGGTYSIQVKNVRGTAIVRNNRLVNGTWVYGPVEADCATIDWSGNTLVTIDSDYRITSTVGPLPCHT